MKKNITRWFYFVVIIFGAVMPAASAAENKKDSGAANVFQGETSEMVLIPEGEFIMGADARFGRIGIDVGVDSIPVRKVYARSFYIDRYEVTNAQYIRFMAATGHPPPQLWGEFFAPQYPPRTDNEPVSDASGYEADAYCKWVGKRLPTEEEWEKAARGTDGRRFPWGNEWKEGIANTFEYVMMRQTPGEKRWVYTVAEAGKFKEDLSPYGIYDMGGNVMEWTSSWYKPYPGNNLKRSAFGEKAKVLRGGSWMSPAIPFAFAFSRFYSKPDLDHPHFGIRCAKDAQ